MWWVCQDPNLGPGDYEFPVGQAWRQTTTQDRNSTSQVRKCSCCDVWPIAVVSCSRLHHECIAARLAAATPSATERTEFLESKKSSPVRSATQAGAKGCRGRHPPHTSVAAPAMFCHNPHGAEVDSVFRILVFENNIHPNA